MANPYLREFDDLLDAILVDYANLDSAPDTSQGSMVFIKSACLASMLYGLYRYQDYISKQGFPDTADTDNLNHWGAVFGITRQVADTDQSYLDKILSRIRKPPAGGNKYDWATWTQYDVNDNPIYATGIAGTTGLYVETAKVIPAAQGPGSVDVVIMPNDTSYINTTGMEDLRAMAYASVDEQRPVTASTFRVLSTALKVGNVSMSVTGPTGVTLDTAQMVIDIQALIDAMTPGDPLYQSQLIAVCINDGAIAATAVAPPYDVIPTNYELIKANSITVTQV